MFTEAYVIDLSLEGPFSTTFADREAREERAFTLQVASTEIPVDVRARGRSRARICSNPPLRLDFDRDTRSDSPFAGHDKLKLVLPCHDSNRAERDVVEEYAAYRIFNQLSPLSFRARLLRIRFLDSDDPEEPLLMERHAFVIESDEDFEARTGLEEAKLPAVRLGELAAEQAALVFIFQYLIGNTDWSLVASGGEKDCCHNIRLFGQPPSLYLLPFDFDLAGLVDADYARPDPSLRLRGVTQRLYRGYCIEPSAVSTALAQVLGKREGILGVLQKLTMLGDRNIRHRTGYLERFFNRAGDQAKTLEKFEEECL